MVFRTLIRNGPSWEKIIQGKFRLFFSRYVGVSFVLFLLQNRFLLQVRPDDLANKYPEIEGFCEMPVPGTGTGVLLGDQSAQGIVRVMRVLFMPDLQRQRAEAWKKGRCA